MASSRYVSTYKSVAAAPQGRVLGCLLYILATISSTHALSARLRMLRLYFRTRPAARGALQKTVGFGGASYISLSLSTPIKIGEKSGSTMAAQDESAGASASGDVRAKTQQSPLASQRSDGQAPGRVAKWFPLSASDGFSQWVSCNASAPSEASSGSVERC